VPHTHSALKVHVIFSTRKQVALLDPALLERLVPYMAKVLRSAECTPLAVNGFQDHMHAVFGYSPRLALSNVIRELKGSSSSWVRHQMPERRNFAWQEGFAAYSVSPSRVPEAVRYVETQEEHHREKSFEEEYLEFLALGGIHIDEPFLSDGDCFQKGSATNSVWTFG
jgi:REP element-mobilizing transposase RayT